MAKVTKKQLGRRRRNALFGVLVFLFILIILISRCSKNDNPADEVSLVPQETTVTTDITGVPSTEVVTLETEETLPTEPAELPTQSIQLDATPVLQNPELPTGCEVTALTMALNYAGYPVDKLTMADQYLIRSDPYLTTFGEAFVGSPHDPTAWGCYAPVIVKTAQNYIAAQGGTEVVHDLTGCSLKTLLWEVANGTPVVTWATIGMVDKVEERFYWTTPEGEDAVFLINEHCVLLCGYDIAANTVTVCDPLKGLTTYDMDIFNDRFEKTYQQAVIITPAETNAETNAAVAD